MHALFRLTLLLLLFVSTSLDKIHPAQTKLPQTISGKVEGWPVEWNPVFRIDQNKKLFLDVKKALANHLQRIKYILDLEKVKILQTLPIRVDLDHKLGNMQYHPNKGWLINNGHDPTLEKRVHVPRARQLLSRDQWAKHPYVILHELAHAYHDQILNFNHKEIIDAYERAEKQGLYKQVLLFRGGKTSHYLAHKS